MVVDLDQSARSNLCGQLENMVCFSFSRVSRASPTGVPPGLTIGTPPRPGYTDAQPFQKNSRQSGSIQHAHEVLGSPSGDTWDWLNHMCQVEHTGTAHPK